MRDFFAWLHDMGINEASMIAGGIGAAVAALRLPGTIAERVGKFTVGFACALWGPGIIIHHLGLPQEAQFYGALGFVFGYFGMTIADALQDALLTIGRHAKEIDWKTIATDWLSRRKP